MAKSKQLDIDPETAQSRMTFGEHLEELRKRLIYALLGSAIVIFGCFFFMNQIIEILVRPYRVAMILNNVPQYFQYTRPHEVVVTYLGIAVKTGLVLSSPWIIYQLWAFVAAGLYPKERKTVYRYVGPSVFLFLAGIAFFYFIVLPVSLNFFLKFQVGTAGSPPTPNAMEKAISQGIKVFSPTSAPATTSASDPATDPNPPPLEIPVRETDPGRPPDGQAYIYVNSVDRQVKLRHGDTISTLFSMLQNSLFANLPRLDDYLAFVTFAALVFGLAFETPMVMMILAQVGIASPQTYRGVRKYAYFTLAVISAVTSPGADVVTMLLLMFPLIGLYEVGIIVSSFVTRKERQKVEEPSRYDPHTD